LDCRSWSARGDTGGGQAGNSNLKSGCADYIRRLRAVESARTCAGMRRATVLRWRLRKILSVANFDLRLLQHL